MSKVLNSAVACFDRGDQDVIRGDVEFGNFDPGDGGAGHFK